MSIHHRTPAILTRAVEMSWVDTTVPVEAARLAMLRFPADRIESYPVSTLVNSPRNDDPACIEPAE